MDQHCCYKNQHVACGWWSAVLCIYKFGHVNHELDLAVFVWLCGRRYELSWCNPVKPRNIYLWRKVVCLFCLYVWDSLNRDASDRILGLFGKLLRRRGALAWFHGVWTCGVEVLEYWMIFSLKIKLYRSWKFRRNWNVLLVLLERSWWAGFNGIYLVRFRFKMWEILIFKWFLPLKVQINFKK